MKRYNILTGAGWATLGFFIAVVLAICFFACSSPFLKTVQEVVNPTITAQLQMPKGLINIKLPAVLPDFVTAGSFREFPVAGSIYGLKFKGVTVNQHEQIIDYYVLVLKRGSPDEPIALRAIKMGTERFWLYVKGIPVPASRDKIKEKVDWFIGKES